MPDWKKPMSQTFEFYLVDPNTWKDKAKLTNIESCTIERDSDTDTLGSASLDIVGVLDECYVRVYLVTGQNGVTERTALGTFLVQPPANDFSGVVTKTSVDAYTPLIELKENQPELGFHILKSEGARVVNIMDEAYRLTRDNARAPVIQPHITDELRVRLQEHFIADPEDSWLTYIRDLMATAKYKYSLDELGRILFAPDQETASLQPVWTYDDEKDSILYPEITVNRDLFGIPNVVEVVYTKNNECMTARVVNDDPNSPTSTVRRGRTITHRDTSPSLTGTPTQEVLEEYAERLLRELSTVEYTISYTHGYCGTRLGDCIRINHKRAGIWDTKAKIISQSIKCTPGTPVSEKAVFTQKLWR